MAKKNNATTKWMAISLHLLSWTILLMILSALFSQCEQSGDFNSDYRKEYSVDSNKVAKGSHIKIIQDEWCYVEELGGKSVCGLIVNDSKKDFIHVIIHINLYDESDVQVESTLAVVEDLQPNGKYRFKAPVVDQESVKYKITSIEELLKI